MKVPSRPSSLSCLMFRSSISCFLSSTYLFPALCLSVCLLSVCCLSLSHPHSDMTFHSLPAPTNTPPA